MPSRNWTFRLYLQCYFIIIYKESLGTVTVCKGEFHLHAVFLIQFFMNLVEFKSWGVTTFAETCPERCQGEQNTKMAQMFWNDNHSMPPHFTGWIIRMIIWKPRPFGIISIQPWAQLLDFSVFDTRDLKENLKLVSIISELSKSKIV